MTAPRRRWRPSRATCARWASTSSAPAAAPPPSTSPRSHRSPDIRAAAYARRGRAGDVITIIELPDPHPGPGEVRVRVAYSGVNPTDWKSRSAGPDLPWDWQVPNQDGSGIIDEVGAGVSPTRVGERVWVFHAAWQRPWGTAAEWTVVPERQAVPLPDDIGLAQAAGLGIPFITAHGCLHGDGPIAGSTILVAGGAGAVGNAAIQVAKRSGATVVTTVSSPAKADLARAAGADAVIDYRAPDAVEQIHRAAPDGIDRIIEVALGANLDLDLAVLRPHRTIVTYASELADPVIPVRRLMLANATLRFAIVYEFTDEMISAAVECITGALSAGALTALPEHRFPLEETAAAHDAVEASAVGKVLIEVAGG